MSWANVAIAGASLVGSLVASHNAPKVAGAAKGAKIKSPVTSEQAAEAYKQSQDALAQQQSFLTALKAQNGIQNQSDVFSQLQGVANGTGPNPAQAMLNNSTGANVANQAAMAAGQRGSSANVGMMQRLAGQQGAGIQQQAAGQGAALQAQQSLNAIQGMGNLASAQVGQEANATNAYNSGVQNEQANLLNSIAGVNSANVGSQGSINSANAGLNQGAQQANNQLVGNLMGGIGTAIGGLGGGTKKNGSTIVSDNTNKYGGGDTFIGAEGGLVADMPKVVGPASKIGQHFHKMANGGCISSYAQGGKVPALVSPGEKYLKPQDVKKVEKGANPMEVGEKIPGKAGKKGQNDYANDVVKKDLDSGGIILPKSVTEHKHPHWAAHKFVSEIMARDGKKLPPKPKAKK